MAEEQEIIRDELGRFIEGKSGNPNGRPIETEEKKLVKKATKEFIAEFKEKLGEALPLISPILVAKALEGDMTAIKEVNDRVMGKPEQRTDITTKGLPIIQLAQEVLEKNEIDISPRTNSEGPASL